MTTTTPPLEDEFALRVAAARGKLSDNDELIIRQIADSLHDLAFHTSDSLAQTTGVSRAAIVRLSRKLGYAGFTEFRNRARREVQAGTPSPLSRFSTAAGVPSEPETLLEQKLRQDARNLALTQELVKDDLPAAAARIADAAHVYVLGTRKSHGLALYFDRLLGGIRHDVTLVDAGYPDVLSRIGKGDVLVVCLFRRYSTTSIRLIEFAKSAGAAVVLLTDGRSHAFAQAADHLLVITTDSPTLYDSMVAPISVLEILGQEIASRKAPATRKSLAAAERFTEEQGLLLE